MKQEEIKNAQCQSLMDWCARDTGVGLPPIGGSVIKTADGYFLVDGDTEQWLGKTMETAAAKIDILRLVTQFSGGTNG